MLRDATIGMDLKNIIQNERSQFKRLPTAWFHVSEKQIDRDRKQITGTRGSEWWMALTIKEHREFFGVMEMYILIVFYMQLCAVFKLNEFKRVNFSGCNYTSIKSWTIWIFNISIFSLWSGNYMPTLLRMCNYGRLRCEEKEATGLKAIGNKGIK